MNIKTIIVDDEPLARERIRTLLREEPDFQVIAECGNGVEAVREVRALAPDLVFLDIQMPGMTGFDVLADLGSDGRLPQIIFVTAFDQHAIRAFEVHALDYLLKPFKQARFKQTLQRVREAVSGKQAGQVSRQLLEFLEQHQAAAASATPPGVSARGESVPESAYISRIPVKTNDRVVFVKTRSIDFIEAAGNYAVLHVGKETHILRETLTALEEKLDPRRFLRISRSTLVNTDEIKELQPLFKGDHVVVLNNGKQLTMTRGLREVQERLKFG